MAEISDLMAAHLMMPATEHRAAPFGSELRLAVRLAARFAQ
jgi:hypothetical protein